ncbi:MAG: SdrD B-like domain-containing protein [Chloroflexota bacterium]
MKQGTHSISLRHSSNVWRWAVSSITALVMSIGNFAPYAMVNTVFAEPAAVPTNHLMLNVVDAGSSSPISDYKYLINIDNTGNPFQPRDAGCSPENAGYPDSCDWPSIRAVPGAAPIYAQGNQDDFNGNILNGLDLPDGRYLVSVLANGYKMGGIHFTIPLQGTGEITVGLQPHPLPAATMRVKIFEDNASVNGQFDTDEHGLEGFHVIINDILGQVSTDVFGNPLCTTYDAGGNPTGINLYGCTTSDANGDTAIPNLGPSRYDVLVSPPSGTDWTETTTLEGSPSWDTWLQEGGTGLDNEFVVAGEPFPWTMFGFVRPMDDLNSGAAGGISGTLISASVYLPQQGALPYFGDIWSGFTGTKVTGPITEGWVALSDLQNGDQAVYVSQANPDGTFAITNVPDGNYLFTWWDTNLHYILDWIQVTVSNGQMTDIGTPMLTGWFTKVEGHVFNDLNANGKRDDGEPGISDYLVVLKDRDNSEIDRMSISAVTDADGYYVFEKAYPMGSWMILEAYSDRYYTTGVTYQVENQPDETTVLGAGVDVGILPILGQAGRLDWGVQPYAPGTNGGIVGTVFYDVTRNELDAQYQAVEGWAPGIPGLLVTLSKPVWCGTTSAPCDPTETYELAPDGSLAKDISAGGVACGTNAGEPCDPSGTWELDASGNFKIGPILSTAITETWEHPTDCIARDANGNPLAYPTDQAVLPPDPTGQRCLEGPLMGTQFQTGFASLDGNYGFDTVYSGFGTATEPVGESIPGDDYLVEVVIPNDALGRTTYQVVREEDINIFDGDDFIPAVPPPACAGPMHIVDVAGVDVDGPNAVDNPSFADAGGSVFEGVEKPLCNVKLVTLNNGKSIAPGFTFFTEVPIPGKWKGYIIDDLTVSTNPMDLMYGEKAGAPLMPIGIYDFTNRRVATMTSDPNGVFEILLPSTHSVNCPTPSGVCPNVYYMLGNDPNLAGYSPQYRTIGASFEIYSGLIIPSDLAPTQIVPGVLAAGSLFGTPPQCGLDPATPQIFSVSRPYVSGSASSAGRTIIVQGLGFGATPGMISLDGSTTGLTVSGWSDTQFTLNVGTSAPAGPHQLTIRSSNGKTTVNGLTIHVVGSGYKPQIFEVGPGRTYATIQSAVNAAVAAGGRRSKLVVVYPSSSGMYLENVIISSKINLQGVGPGGEYPGGTRVIGSVIDGRGVTGDNPYGEAWNVSITGLNWSGNQSVSEGPVVYVVAQDGNFNNTNPASIDGFVIQGGDQQGFPNQVVATADPSVKEVTGVQGGGIYVNGYARYLRITNNILQSNGGSYGGAIRLGTPNLPGAFNDSQNDFIRIANNRIVANGSANLAGAVAIYSGAQGYEVSGNDICGNFSAEYGGGISHYGLSPNGNIHHNRIYFNRSYDEGGGVFIAGELPSDPDLLTPGAGPVNVYANLIQNNLANDDGGGIRFLMSGDFPYNVYNNIIVNNISTHEGAGVSLNDAPDVRFFNNTVMKNITTATAMTSNGQPAPAGLSSSRNSNLLQATLPGSSPLFSEPLLFNNIFWDNRAGTFVGSAVAGIGLTGDPNPINYWDLGVSDGTGLLSPTDSILQTDFGTIPSGTNQFGDPDVLATYDTTVRALPWRGNPRFVDILMITTDATPNLLGDYHINSTSPAFNAGAASAAAVNAPADDFDGHSRPAGGGYDVGADEIPPNADLSITKTDNQTNVTPGTQIRYTITVSNAGPEAVTGATVTDLFPTRSPLSGTINWTCTTTGGASCGGTGTGSGNINRSVDLPVGSTVTFMTTSGSVASNATGFLTNTASVSTVGVLDPDLSNNTATDIDTIAGTSNLGVTQTDNISVISAGGHATYSIVVSNSGPQAVAGATVTDTLSAGYESFSWVCSTTGGSSCTIDSGSETTFNGTVDLTSGGVATFTATAVISATATGSVTNTVTVTPPANVTDPNPANNTAVDTDIIISAPALPTLSALDNFDRANATTLGGNWSQIVLLGSAGIRVNTNQALALQDGSAIWNNPSSGYANRQGASFTFSNTPIGGTALDPGLVLKATGGSSTTPANYLRVTYNHTNNEVTVTTVSGGTITTRATFAATFTTNDTLSATAIANGTVYVYKNGTSIGAVTVPTGGAGGWKFGKGGGRIGLILPAGQRVDNFNGGTIP